MERLNLELANTTLNDRFVTFLLCVLDPVKHLLEVVNAGHPAPLRCRGKSIEKLGVEEAGPPLGLDLQRGYASFTTPVAESDTIVLYTDGISEARSQATSFTARPGSASGSAPDRPTPSRSANICSMTSKNSRTVNRKATTFAS